MTLQTLQVRLIEVLRKELETLPRDRASNLKSIMTKHGVTPNSHVVSCNNFFRIVNEANIDIEVDIKIDGSANKVKPKKQNKGKSNERNSKN